MRSLFSLTLLALAGAALAQPATAAQRAGVPNDKSFGTIHWQAALGSFRLIDGQGRVEMTCRGTVLISQLTGFEAGSKGSVKLEGDFIKQYDKDGRQVYFGKGKVIVTGKWRGVQVFGQQMAGTWFGTGRIRLDGEFDSKLESGFFWYDDPTKKTEWPTSGTLEYPVPGRP